MPTPDRPVSEILTVDTSRVERFVERDRLSRSLAGAGDALEQLAARTCTGAELTGWLDLPERMLAGDLARIQGVAERLRARHDTLVVVGIGGSSLGARAALAALGYGAGEEVAPLDEHPVVFAGHHLSAATLRRTLASLGERDYAVNVISKSGTTTEPGIAFRVFLDELRRRHGDGWRSRVVATTDASSGALRALADEHGLETFAVPGDVGGRFSILSPVGLVPLAVAGADVHAMVEGARETLSHLLADRTAANPAVALAAARHALFTSGYTVDVLSYTSPRLRHVAGWWQQLFGESEGKRHRGAFPATCEIPADLHSLGQYMQDGSRQVYETFLHVTDEGARLEVPPGDARDGLDYLTGTSLATVLEAARAGTVEAHASGGVPLVEISVPDLAAASLGSLVATFEVVVALGGALLEVNPFDQPGVEAYKRNMFRLLGRPE